MPTPPPPSRGFPPTASRQWCCPQVSMSPKSAQCSMNTKGALKNILSALHPNTILEPTRDSNAHFESSAYLYPYT